MRKTGTVPGRPGSPAKAPEAEAWGSTRGPGISLAMIVRDEAHCIGHCLQSVRGLVDEMIVVDTGSVDATPRISEQAGARVFHFPWSEDFSAARNESLRHCCFDWILVLDADESIDASDHDAIRAACGSARTKAYRMALRNYCHSANYTIRDVPAVPNQSTYHEGHEYPFYVETHVFRLCRNHPELSFTGRVHELLDPFFKARNIPIEPLAGPVIHHFGKLDAARESMKVRTYLDMALRDAQSDPRNPEYHFNVIQQGMFIGEWATVIRAARSYMGLRPSAPPAVLLGAGLALQKLGNHTEALGHFERLLKLQPAHALAMTLRGVSRAAVGREKDAERDFREAMALNPQLARPFNEFTELAFRQGRIEAAKTVARQGVESSPLDPRMHASLILLDLRLNDMERAMADAREALRILPKEGGGLWHRLSARAALQEGRTPEAARILDAAIGLFPENEALRGMRSELPD